MERRKIGSLDVSVVGLGTNNFGMRMDEERSREVLHAALDLGVNHIDTADIYGATKSEEFIGRSLGSRRDEAVLVTKFGMPLGEKGGAAPAYVRSALDDSLRRLQTDRIDLYLLHQPDPATPIAETLAALDDGVRAGKIVEVGCSNFSAAQLKEADAAVADGAARFVCVQNHYNLLRRDDELDAIPAARELGLAYVPFFPLAMGALTGKYQRDSEPPAGTRLAGIPAERRDALLTDRTFDVVEVLTTWAADHGHSVLDAAFAWLAAKEPVASVIAGATSPEQVAANAAAASWTLTPAEVAELDALTQP